MANIFRIIKDKNYTIINNDYLKNKNLRLDSIGLLTLILSLPSDFNITMKGLISLTNPKANYRAIKIMLDNLKENGYLEINKLRDDKGHFFFNYIFFENNKLNPLYNNWIVDNSNITDININCSNNPPPINPPLVVDENKINTIINNKINIDKNKLNLCFLTEYLIDWNFISINDINLFGYDSFLLDLLNNENYEYDVILKCISYVVKKIIYNKYLDEDENKINDLLVYFKTAVINNLNNMNEMNQWLESIEI